MRSHHDSLVAEHPGQKNTFEKISRDHYWPGMRRFIKDYVCSCETHAHPKHPDMLHTASYNLFQSLPMHDRQCLWISLWNYPNRTLMNHDAILVCVNRFSKMEHCVPTRSNVTAKQTAALYVKEVFHLHGLPKDIVSDMGQQFTSRFTRRLL